MEKERNEIREFSIHLPLVIAKNKVVHKMMEKVIGYTKRHRDWKPYEKGGQ